MNLDDLDKKLREINKRESIYRQTNKLPDNYKYLDEINVNGKCVYIFDNFIPAGRSYEISKHLRFIPVPMHIHSFIELNYIYSGECNQYIYDKKVNLKKGQICLIDTAVPHSIENTCENDIIINILVKKEYLAKQLSQENFDRGIVFDFMLNALSETQSHNQYIVFKNKEYTQVNLIIQQILFEYFYPSIGSSKIIENLISILFTLLVRDFDYETNKEQNYSKRQIVDILQYIDKNFMNLTLTSLSKVFDYTPTYLSALIKKETGKKFSQLILEKKLYKAENLIRNTSNPIDICAMESGFSNMTFFYKKFRNHFGKNPGEIN